MSEPKPLGYIRNLANGDMAHLVYPGAHLSFAFPIGHVYEMAADGDVPLKEFQEKDLGALIETEKEKVLMTRVFQVLKMRNGEEFCLMATRSTKEKAENFVKRYFAPDLLGTVYVTILEVWTNAKPQPEWDED